MDAAQNSQLNGLSLRLHREPVVARRVQKVEARHWRQGQIERAGERLVARLHLTSVQIPNDLRPDRLRLTDDDAVGVVSRFVGHERHMETAEDDSHTRGAIAVGERVGILDHRGEAGDCHRVEVTA
jgi:hypothetical protein